MGAAQYDGRPSDALEARLVEAKRLYNAGLIKKIVTVGAGAPGDRYTEASAGRSWLTQNGIPSKNAIEIGKGRNTIQSVKAFTDYFKKNGINQIIIVTDPYHCKTLYLHLKRLRDRCFLFSCAEWTVFIEEFISALFVA
jgi:vancomycin permeability regulator SanA